MDTNRNIAIEKLKKHFDEQTYDKKYQDIECLNMTGYVNSAQTWENIKDLVNWKGKKVADLGCFHGYFSFKAAKAGAIVTGFDISDGVLKTTSLINEVEGNIITLQQWCGGEEIPSIYDISLCLNVLHHFADKPKALENIKSEIVIFETNIDLIEMITKEFNIIERKKSHRTDSTTKTQRIILLCKRIFK